MLCFLHPCYFILVEISLFLSPSHDIQLIAGLHLHATYLCSTMRELFLTDQDHYSSQGVTCIQGVISQTCWRNWKHAVMLYGEFLVTCTTKADSRDFIIWSLDNLRIKREDRVFQLHLFVFLCP